MITVYILHSDSLKRHYVGMTKNLRARLKQHIRGSSRWTARAADWTLIHQETYPSREEARAREIQIKSVGTGRFLKMHASQSREDAGQG